jgi:predicted phage terminase large subunit-like protein
MSSTYRPVDEILANDPEARAVVEIFRRRKAKESLLGFVEYTYPNYRAASHHRLIASKLEAVARGEIDRLMIACPPRHGKSELASKRFIAWLLGGDPTKTIITASYNSDIAGDFGREVRNIVGSPEFGRVFDGVELASDSRASDRWHTSKGGSYVAAGVGTAITGRGAHVLVIDDPHKDREEADSDTMRRRVKDWYTSTAYTRLAPGGAVIVIATRWHEDDLSGWLLSQAENGGDDWHLIDLPALALDDDQMGRDAGEPLWPQAFDKPRLERIRANLPSRDWSALYQQRPTPDDGEFFLKDWLRHYDDKPADLVKRVPMRIIGASDYATKDGAGDYTVHGVFGIDHDGDVHVLDWWRKQATSLVWAKAMCDLMDKWKPREWLEEKGVIANTMAGLLDQMQRDRRLFIPRKGLPSTGAQGNKAAKAQAIRGMFEMGKVWLPKDGGWVPDLITEMMKFDAGKHDDQVDVLSLIGRHVRKLGRPNVKKAPEEAKHGLGHVTMDMMWKLHKPSQQTRLI